MSDDHSGGEGSVGHEADFVDTTEDMEVELRLIKTPTRVELERDLGFPGPGGQWPRGGTQFEPDPY